MLNKISDSDSDSTIVNESMTISEISFIFIPITISRLVISTNVLGLSKHELIMHHYNNAQRWDITITDCCFTLSGNTNQLRGNKLRYIILCHFEGELLK